MPKIKIVRKIDELGKEILFIFLKFKTGIPAFRKSDIANKFIKNKQIKSILVNYNIDKFDYLNNYKSIFRYNLITLKISCKTNLGKKLLDNSYYSKLFRGNNENILLIPYKKEVKAA